MNGADFPVEIWERIYKNVLSLDPSVRHFLELNKQGNVSRNERYGRLSAVRDQRVWVRFYWLAFGPRYVNSMGSISNTPSMFTNIFEHDNSAAYTVNDILAAHKSLWSDTNKQNTNPLVSIAYRIGNVVALAARFLICDISVRVSFFQEFLRMWALTVHIFIDSQKQDEIPYVITPNNVPLLISKYVGNGQVILFSNLKEENNIGFLKYMGEPSTCSFLFTSQVYCVITPIGTCTYAAIIYGPQKSDTKVLSPCIHDISLKQLFGV